MKPHHLFNGLGATRRQQGLGAIAAIVVVVMLSALAAAVTRMTWTQQTSFAQDLNGAKAFQAANAGTEWGMYQALKGSWQDTACAGSSTTLDLRSTMGFRVTVTCLTSTYVEGQDSLSANTTVRLYTINAVACNGSTPTCPDNASSAGVAYVERSRQAIVSQTNNGL